jgi:cytochrome P450
MIDPPSASFNLQLMLPTICTCCEELVNRWTQSLGLDGTFEVDVFPELKRLTGDVISRTAFGSNYLEGARIFQLQSEQVERLIAGALKIAIPGYL